MQNTFFRVCIYIHTYICIYMEDFKYIQLHYYYLFWLMWTVTSNSVTYAHMYIYDIDSEFLL